MIGRVWQRAAAWLHRVLSKEPVMAGAATIAVYEAAVPEASSAWKIAIGAVVAWIVRLFSTPETTAREREVVAAHTGHVEGYAAAADDVRSLAGPPSAVPGPPDG